MSQLEAIKDEIRSMQEYYQKEIKMLNDRIDHLTVKLYEALNGKCI